MNWEQYISKAHTRLCEKKNNKELGKLRAYSAELMVRDHLNALASSHVIFVHVDDLCNHKKLSDMFDCNQSGFDIVGWNKITNTIKKIQVKYRSSTIYLETTRRNSQKNADKNASGHISYSSNEFDFLVVVKSSFDDIIYLDSSMTIFPVNSLVNKKDTRILVNYVSQKTVQTHQSMYQKLLQEMLQI